MRKVSENLRVRIVGITWLSFIREEFARTIDPSGDTEITDSPTYPDCIHPSILVNAG
mgnify:FL=1